MKKVIALEDVKLTIVKGSGYSVEECSSNENYYVVTTEQGKHILFLKSHFEIVEE